MVNIRLILSLTTALAAGMSFAQQVDDGMNDRRLKLPTFLDEATKQRYDESKIEKTPEKGLNTKIEPLLKPKATKAPLVEQSLIDNQGLRKTIVDRPVQPQKTDDGAIRARFQTEKEARAKNGAQAIKDALKSRPYGPALEAQPGPLMATSSDRRTGIAPLPLPKTKKSDDDSLKDIAKRPKTYTNKRRTITAGEVALYRKNSPLHPLARVVPVKPYEVPLDLTVKGRVANPYMRGAIIDPVSGSIILESKIVREISPTGLTVLGKDTGALTPAILDNDAFQAQGLRAGGFILRPGLEVSTGFDDNPTRISPTKPSAFVTTRASLTAASDFSRHAINADISGSASAFSQNTGSYRPDLNIALGGRVDIRSDQSLNLEAKYKLTSLAAESAVNATNGTIIGEPLVQTYGLGAAYNVDFNRLIFSLRGSLSRKAFEDAHYSDNTVTSGTNRNYNTGRVALRGMYKHSEEVRPFVEVFSERRVYDTNTVTSKLQGADAYGAKAGVRFDMKQRLSGEVSVGYALRHNREPSLSDLRGLIFDAALVWAATGLTNVTLKGGTSFDESAISGVSTVYNRDVSVQVDHAFRRYLIGSARIGAGYDTYEGTSQQNTRLTGALGLAYKFTRDVSIAGEVRHTRFTTNTTGNYNNTVVMLGVKLAR
jgi:hypothetical protein